MMSVRYLSRTACVTVLALGWLAGCTADSLFVDAEAPALRLSEAPDAARTAAQGYAEADGAVRDGRLTGHVTFEVFEGSPVAGHSARGTFRYKDADGLWFESEIQQSYGFDGHRALFGGPVQAGSKTFLVPTWVYVEAEDGRAGAPDLLRYRFGPPDAMPARLAADGWTTLTFISGDLQVGWQGGGFALTDDACEHLTCQEEPPGDDDNECDRFTCQGEAPGEGGREQAGAEPRLPSAFTR